MQKPGTPTTTVASAQTLTTTTTLTTVVNSGNYGTAAAYLNVSAASGTTPSMTVKFQDSPDKTIWTDVPSGAFSAATTVSTSRVALVNVGPYLRAVATITGTTPSFTFDLKVSGVN